MTRHAISALLLLSLHALVPLRTMAVDFDKDIVPILKKNCYECHSEENKKEKAGYVFDNKARLKKDIAPNMLIEPGDPGRSHLMRVLAESGFKNHMPPDEDLSSGDLEKIRQWISEGATLDKDAPKVAVKKSLPPIMTWVNADGKKIKAGFGGMQGDNVILKMPNGQLVPYPVAKLAAESQQQAKECAAP
jgi:hypothetical protein